MSTLFVSYARQDRARVEDLTRRLPRLGHQVWLDAALRGGQSWWDEILAQIAACDAFLAVVSRASLDSVACQREREYAEALGRPILPVAVETLTQAMPRELSVRQVVDYSVPGEDAAFALAGALAGLPPAPPLPQVLPPPPAAPLSYLTDLVEQLEAPELTKAQQRQILDDLEPALRSGDIEERTGGLQILDRLSRRDDLFADTERRISSLTTVGAAATSESRAGPPRPRGATDSATTPPPPRVPPRPPPPANDGAAGPVWSSPGPTTTPAVRPKNRSTAVTVLAVVGGAVVLLVILAVLFADPGPTCFFDAAGNYLCG
jgi:hypothetical protein